MLYHLRRKLADASSTEELLLLRAHVVYAAFEPSLRMLVPKLHVFLPKIGRFEETAAANMALLPGRTLLPTCNAFYIAAISVQLHCCQNH